MHPFLQRGSIIDGDEVEATHKQLEDLIRQSMRSRSDPEHCSESIGRIQTLLPQHMDFEECQGGLFTWLEALLPERRDEVRGLMAQHQDLREAVAILAPDNLRDFAQLFLEHEAAEGALLDAARRVAQG
jgi:hypothetical protein